MECEFRLDGNCSYPGFCQSIRRDGSGLNAPGLRVLAEVFEYDEKEVGDYIDEGYCLGAVIGELGLATATEWHSVAEKIKAYRTIADLHLEASKSDHARIV